MFDYLRTDELGLSRIIADLLDPEGAHGQRTLFLERFLCSLGKSVDLGSRFFLESPHISVQAEAGITDKQRIDVLVQFDNVKESHALAIENKPYADDGHGQIRHYLNYLDERFGRNFLLVYLSPTGTPPSDISVCIGELTARWTNRFGILPYRHQKGLQARDPYDDFRISKFSLADWLQTCKRDCEVDRLRLFLGDMADFCQRKFSE